MLGRLTLRPAPSRSKGRPPAPLARAAGDPRQRGRFGGAARQALLYLWPESNTQRARTLHQALHTTRRHLGEDVVQADALTVRLNPSVFSSDLWDFLATLDRGDVEQAVELYEGGFLEGLALPELPEFTRWIEEERRRIAHLYSDALEAAAARASREGRHHDALERWQALARHDPLSSRPTLGLMRALADAGDSAAALAHARDYETRVRRELGTAPDQSIAALAAELRQPPPAGESGAVTRSPENEESASRRRGVPTRVWKAAVIGLALMDLMALTALWLTRRHPPHRPVDPDLIAVFPFTIEGGPDAQYLASGMVDLLTSNLEGAGGIRGVDPLVLLESAGEAQCAAADARAGPRGGRSVGRRPRRVGERRGKRRPAPHACGGVRPR